MTSGIKFIGEASCGCVHHADDGDPCEHDIDLLLNSLKATAPVMLMGVDNTGNETWVTTLVDFVEGNRDDPDTIARVIGLMHGQTIRCDGFVGNYIDVTRIG